MIIKEVETIEEATRCDALLTKLILDEKKYNPNIKEDVVITCKAIFGGIDLVMPSNVKVKVKSNSVFGGVENQYTNDEGKVTIYVDATCVFGGIDIK